MSLAESTAPSNAELHARTVRGSGQRVPSTLGRRAWRPWLMAVIALIVGWALSQLLPVYFVYLATGAVIATISLLGLGVVTGTAGMIALCQLSFGAVGAWTVSWLAVMQVPGGLMVWIWAGGAAAGVAGLVLGLPALRLRGVNLAVVTLGFAAAADLTLRKMQFPGTLAGVQTPRPSLFQGDRGYFIFAVIVLIICALGVYFLQNSRMGTGWKFVAFSERATASAGTGVPRTKLTAFAVGAAMAGVAGGLLSGQIGVVYATSFTSVQSLAMYVLSVVSGSYLIDMAVLGGILWILVPEVLKRMGISQDWGFVVFGVLGIQALAGNGNLGTAVRNLWARRSRRPTPTPAPSAAPEQVAVAEVVPPAVVDLPVPAAGSVLAVESLSVSFGNIHALKDVAFTLQEGTVTGLIGPNGAGKSTLIDALSGFLPSHSGTVELRGDVLGRQGPAVRAQLGLRRTFQQDRVPLNITVGAYMRFMTQGKASWAWIEEALEHFGCPPAHTPLEKIDVGTRRMIEVAANVAARPAVLLLDEPAAGVSHQGHIEFARQLATAPAKFATTILLIEHDLDLVRAVCSRLIALDFGQVIADGTQQDVLSDPKVVKAYMGEIAQ